MRIWLRPEERRPDPEVVRTDDRRVVLAGIGVWAVALVVCLVDRDRLVAGGDGWWVWVCVAGIALGIAGLAHVQRQRVRDQSGERPGLRLERGTDVSLGAGTGGSAPDGPRDTPDGGPVRRR